MSRKTQTADLEKTQTSKTQTSKTQTSKTQTPKTQTSKTQTSKTQTLEMLKGEYMGLVLASENLKYCILFICLFIYYNLMASAKTKTVDDIGLCRVTLNLSGDSG